MLNVNAQLSNGVPLFNTLYLSNLWEYHYKLLAVLETRLVLREHGWHTEEVLTQLNGIWQHLQYAVHETSVAEIVQSSPSSLCNYLTSCWQWWWQYSTTIGRRQWRHFACRLLHYTITKAENFLQALRDSQNSRSSTNFTDHIEFDNFVLTFIISYKKSSMHFINIINDVLVNTC